MFFSFFYSAKRLAAVAAAAAKTEAQRVSDGMFYVKPLNVNMYSYIIILFHFSENRATAARIEADRVAEGML